VESLAWFGGLIETNVAHKHVCFGVDGIIVFQGGKIWITTPLKNYAPYLNGVHTRKKMEFMTNLCD
jgi:hypothetical protein